MRRKTLSIPMCVVIFATIFVMAHVSAATVWAEGVVQEWVARYNGPANRADKPTAMAVDKFGNVYVTGTTNYLEYPYPDSDYATVKYDPNGNELWAAYYGGPGEATDEAYALAVDEQGNVYVTGTSYNYGTSYHYATIKYDTDGNAQWVMRYNKGLNDAGGVVIAVDDWDNVYVGGNSGSYNTRDYTTIKYDTDGNELWVALYDGPSNFQDDVRAIVVDGSGNVYVTGSSRWYGGARHGNYDYATVKYDASGNKQWVACYSGSGEQDHWGNAIAVDDLGNVYVTGKSYDSDTDYDYATIKYDADGNEQWVARYNGPRYREDAANALVLDHLRNVYVTGNSVGIGTYSDYATVKYDPDGNQLWVARYNGVANGYDEARALSLDDSGNTYVTGFGYILNGRYSYNDFETIKYDPNGHHVWLARYDGPAMEGNKAAAIVVDDSGNVYVTGESGALGPGTDYATIKYTQPDDFPEPASIQAAIDIDPNTLNLNSKGNWITCYIWLPEGYDVDDVDTTTIVLKKDDFEVGGEYGEFQTGKLMVKFPRSQVQDILEPGEVELTVTGELVDGTKFGGSDTIRVINKGGKK